MFNGADIEAAALLAREAIQNSVDAAAEPGREVEVRFEERMLDGDDRRRFKAAAQLEDIGRRADVLQLAETNMFTSPDDPLRVLYVVDRGTKGLSGDPAGSGSKLRKLLMEIGGSRKTKEAHTGGSFGFGKAVYGGSSRIATIFAYSRTRDERGRPLSVLMGCACHSAHEFERRATTGRGFFGRTVRVPGKGNRHDPFVGEEADASASELGMARAADDLGTTILIVDAAVDLDPKVSNLGQCMKGRGLPRNLSGVTPLWNVSITIERLRRSDPLRIHLMGRSRRSARRSFPQGDRWWHL